MAFSSTMSVFCSHANSLCWLTLSLEFCFVAHQGRHFQAGKASPTESFTKPLRNLKTRARRDYLPSVFFPGKILDLSWFLIYSLQSSSGGMGSCPFHQETLPHVYPKFPLLLFKLTAACPSPVRDGKKIPFCFDSIS